MRYAVAGDEPRAEATPRARGRCPSCDGVVKAKCGPIVTHHWAHLAADCDEWAEPDTPWHRDWQACAPPDRREVTMGRHRADLLTAGGMVVELQHSTISGEDIAGREAFYGRMIWIFDARSAVHDERLNLRTKLSTRSDYRTFRWKHPREAPCGGWGHLGTAAQLREWIAGDYLHEWVESELAKVERSVVPTV